MNYDQEYAIEDAVAERGIELEAMSDAEIECEYARRFLRLPSSTTIRFDMMIEELLTKLRSEL